MQQVLRVGCGCPRAFYAARGVHCSRRILGAFINQSLARTIPLPPTLGCTPPWGPFPNLGFSETKTIVTGAGNGGTGTILSTAFSEDACRLILASFRREAIERLRIGPGIFAQPL